MVPPGFEVRLFAAEPEVVNSDPYGKGWMAVIDLTAPAEVDQLMTAAQYETFLSKQKH